LDYLAVERETRGALGVRVKVARIPVLYIFLALLPTFAFGQKAPRTSLEDILETEGCVTSEQSNVTICKYDYSVNDKKIEAFTIRPFAEGKYPGIVLLSGREGARTSFTFASILVRKGFACVAISEPGYGKSEGKADFMGPASIDVFAKGFRRFRRERFVDPAKMGVYGYSRGGMAASLLTLKLGEEVKAAVFGAGVYDLKRAYDETKFDAIRESIKGEAGITEKAMRERSSIRLMQKLKTPVLIIHGENDDNVPPNQALLLRDRLAQLKKEFEIVILTDHKHGQLKGNFIDPVISFFIRRLKPQTAN
jgi:dipeptidyl aminopeptidase/acylaminoacyl peptidase